MFPRNESRNEGTFTCSSGMNQGSVNGGFQTVVRVWSGEEQIPAPHFLFVTSILINLCSAGNLEPRFGNHCLQILGRKPEHKYIRRNQPFTKPPLCLLSTLGAEEMPQLKSSLLGDGRSHGVLCPTSGTRAKENVSLSVHKAQIRIGHARHHR